MRIQSVRDDKEIETVVDLAHKIWREHYTKIIGKAQVDYMLRIFQSKKAIQGQLEDGASHRISVTVS